MTTCRAALGWMSVFACVRVCVLYLKWQAFSVALIREMFVVGANLENKQDFREISDLCNAHTCVRTHTQTRAEKKKKKSAL